MDSATTRISRARLNICASTKEKITGTAITAESATIAARAAPGVANTDLISTPYRDATASAPTTQMKLPTPAAIYGPRAGRWRMACKIWPMPARSSLAAGRGVASPSGQLGCDASLENSSALWGVDGTAGSLSAAGPKDVSARVSGGRTLRASWMAERASSVASFDFCELCAIAVRAVGLRRPCRRGPNETMGGLCRQHGLVGAIRAASSPPYRPVGILSPCHYERNHGGKAFFTILNCLLTITNVAPWLGNADHGCQDEAAYRQMIDALKTLK